MNRKSFGSEEPEPLKEWIPNSRPLKVGDDVQLHSGGPSLVVLAITEKEPYEDRPTNEVHCAYRATRYEITVPEACLKLLVD